MTLRGGIYAGTISGVIALNGQLTGHYVAEPAPKIVIGRSALPDTVPIVSASGLVEAIAGDVSATSSITRS